MQWAVSVTTAPRPTPTLSRTLASLERAGFAEATVLNDAGRDGAWPNWLQAVRVALAARPRAESLLICQDDVVCCSGLREYLDRTLWPSDCVAICSPYCPGAYRQRRQGWRLQRRGWHLVGALCWAVPRAAAEAILCDLGQVEAQRHVDARIGKWAADTGRTVWYHTPSLVQHEGIGNSALGDPTDNTLRRAVDFVGEAVEMRD